MPVSVFTSASLRRCLTNFSLVAFTILFFAGCGNKQAGGPPGMGPGGPLEVNVVTIASTNVTLTQDLPGRISAYRVAEVRARVNGIVLHRHFTEGADVKEGELLYEIDPARAEHWRAPRPIW